MLPRTQKNPHLKLFIEDRRSFITVPSESAKTLRSYLLVNGVQSRHPEPVTPGMDSIELLTGYKEENVQRLLNQWSKI